MGIDNPIHLIFLAGVALLVLGPKRLPEVARSLGKGIREFRDAMSDGSVGGLVHAHEDTSPVSGQASLPPEAEVVADSAVQGGGPAGAAGGGAVVDAPGLPPEAEVVADGGSAQHAGLEDVAGGDGAHGARTGDVAGGDAAHGARTEDVAAVGDAPEQVDPAQPVRSGDAPDRRPL
jgi:TatA/E family protein of Tat protein translocase